MRPMLLALIAACCLAAEPARPATWAQPVEGVKNLHRVSADLYRSAQPDDEDMRRLVALGVKGVLNLRAYHSDDDEAKGTTLVLARVAMDAGEVDEDLVVAALRALKALPRPALVHCWHGADRTGAIIAFWRILEQGWSREAAIAEMIEGGYGHHSMYGNLPRLLRSADLERIRTRVAQAAPAGAATAPSGR